MLGVQDSDWLDLDSFVAEGSSAVQNLLEFARTIKGIFLRKDYELIAAAGLLQS